jgi:hypothetical protein
MKRNDGDLPVPFEPGEGLADQPITRSRAIKLFGATIAGGALIAFLPAEADARPNRKQRRQRRARRARRRRQAAVTSPQPVVNFNPILNVPVTELVDVTNNGPDTVTIDPTVVGEGFTLGDLSNLDLRLEPGETVQIPVILTALNGGVQEGTLRVVDARDGLVLEVVELVGEVDVL